MSDLLSRRRSHMVARTYYATKKEGAKIATVNFELVDWEGMGSFMKSKQ